MVELYLQRKSAVPSDLEGFNLPLEVVESVKVALDQQKSIRSELQKRISEADFKELTPAGQKAILDVAKTKLEGLPVLIKIISYGVELLDQSTRSKADAQAKAALKFKVGKVKEIAAETKTAITNARKNLVAQWVDGYNKGTIIDLELPSDFR